MQRYTKMLTYMQLNSRAEKEEEDKGTKDRTLWHSWIARSLVGSSNQNLISIGSSIVFFEVVTCEKRE